MVIYLDQYALAKTASATGMKDDTYADEIMDANWNPALLQMVRETVPAAPSPDLPDDLSSVDMEAFLDRVRALATLI